MKFLSLKNPKAVTFLFNVVTGVLALLVIYSMALIVSLQFIVPSSFILIVYDVLLVFLLRYEGFMPDRYWEWYVKGYNEFKVSIGTWVFLLAYTALVIYIYGDEMKLSYLESREDYKLEDENS